MNIDIEIIEIVERERGGRGEREEREEGGGEREAERHGAHWVQRAGRPHG